MEVRTSNSDWEQRLIRAEFSDGHWRVVDDFGCRYMPAAESSDGALSGVFATRDFAAERWDVGTQFDEQTALLLAGTLRKTQSVQDELMKRIMRTCDACNKSIRNMK